MNYTPGDLALTLYQDAGEYIYMSYPWYVKDVTKKDLEMIKTAAERGVKVYICYGIMPRKDKKGGYYKEDDLRSLSRTRECIKEWKKQLIDSSKNGKDIVEFRPVDSHCKIILCEKYALAGSQNMMSYRPEKWSKDVRNEITIKYTNQRMISELKKIIVEQEECSDIDTININRFIHRR